MDSIIESEENATSVEPSENNRQELTINNEADNTIIIATDNGSTINEIVTMETNSEVNNIINSIINNEKNDKLDCVTSNELEIEKCESPLRNEHSYANIENKDLHILTETISDTLNNFAASNSVLQMEILNDIVITNNEKNDNDLNIVKYDSIPEVGNEVVVTESISIINQKDGVGKMHSELFYVDKRTPLEAIALQYDSSDSEDERNFKSATEVSNTQDYRIKDEVVLSSDESADSESDSSSSSDSDSSSPNINNSIDSDDDDDDDGNKDKNKSNHKKTFKSKGEYDNLPPIEDLKISVPEVLCDPLGEVAWTVDQMVVVKPNPGKPTLNLETVLFIERGQRALGHIFDVFGQVTEPHYCVRFNSSEHIQESEIKVGMPVYYCPNTPYTSLVFLAELKKTKAADEVDEDESPEFSDDEEEQAYLASLKAKNSANTNASSSQNEVPKKRRRGNKSGWQSNHPWNSKKDNAHQNLFPQEPKPFYRTHHPWSRPRYQQHNPRHWHNNLYPNNQWVHPHYNNMQMYNNYVDPRHMSQPPPPPMGMSGPSYPPMQWNPHHHAAPVQGFSQNFIPPFILPPPPPPPSAPTPPTQPNVDK